MKRYLINVLLALDALWNALLGGNRPLELISSAVGRKAHAGIGWARLAEQVIDWIFVRLGGGPGHCRRIAIKYGNLEGAQQ